MTHTKVVSPWYGRCLIISAAVLSVNDSLAAVKNKHHTHPSTRELLLKVKERDDVIKNLLLRVEALENKRDGAVVTQPGTVDANPSISPSQPPATEVAAQTAQTNNPPPSQTTKPDAPGQFDVDVQASQRALERTLAKSGALLLPSGYLDTDFNFTFTHREMPSLVASKDLKSIFLGSNRQNIFEPSLAFRLGLPFDSQLEFSLPYRFIDYSTVVSGQSLDIKENNSGLGDVEIGVAKTVLKEDKWWPDLIARVNWNTGSGSSDINNGLGSITASMVALKRQDPLAFFFSGAYTKSFTEKNYLAGKDGNISYTPGDVLAFSFGAQLAASSDTSLSFSLDQLFVSNVEQGSDTIAGSNRNMGILSLGASSIITRNFFVNVSAGMGLTNDAPDYTAGITLSNRTNLRPYLGLK